MFLTNIYAYKKLFRCTSLIVLGVRSSLTVMAASSSSTHCKHSRNLNDETDLNNTTKNVLDLKLKKVAIIGKMTRYEFEKQRYDNYTEDQFKEVVSICLDVYFFVCCFALHVFFNS